MFKKSYEFLLEKVIYLFIFIYSAIFLLVLGLYFLYTNTCKKTGKDVPKVTYIVCGIISVPIWWTILIGMGLLVGIPISKTIAGIIVCIVIPLVVIMSVFVFE